MDDPSQVIVNYLDPPYTITINEVPRRGMMQLAPGQGSDGYGRKISTDYLLHLPGNPKKYRVYAVCFSNAASHYIVKDAKTLYLRSYELQEERDKARAS